MVTIAGSSGINGHAVASPQTLTSMKSMAPSSASRTQIGQLGSGSPPMTWTVVGRLLAERALRFLLRFLDLAMRPGQSKSDAGAKPP
jgi:hypothetical protein